MASRSINADAGDHASRRHPRRSRRGDRLGHARPAAHQARLARGALLPAGRARRSAAPLKVFIYVQHLLGIGHLRRAATLARALAAAGFEVTLASGGMPVEGIPVLQLPPASSDAGFKQLLDENGNPVDRAWKARRREALLRAFRDASPDALLIELFPFGRRQMRFELLPLLGMAREAARRPLIVCSVRDLIQPRPSRETEMLECFEHYYDRLLVHGDPRIATFERSFGATARLAGRLHYT